MGDTFSYDSHKTEMSIFKIPMMKKITIVYFLLLTSFTFTILTSCTNGFISEDVTTNPPSGGPITYETHIRTVMTSNCISCHGGSNPQGNLLLETYSQVRNSAENGLLIQRINDVANPMPPASLMSTSTRTLLDEWVQNGYLEN